MFGLVKFREPMSLMRELEQQFNELWRDFHRPRQDENLACEAYESDNDFLLICAAPGFERDEIDVELKEDMLTINAEHVETIEEEEEGKKVERTRTTRRLSNTFRLSEKIDHDNIGVSLKDGLLRITLPKAPESKPRKIEVN